MSYTEATYSSYSWKRDPLFWAYSIIMFLPIIMVFAFYNHYNLDFLVYTGWILLGFSVVIIFLAGGEFRKKGGAPTKVLVDSGVYSVVRHPQYVTFMLWAIAGMLLFQHWIIILLGIPIIPLTYIDLIKADRDAIEKFGDEYKAYMRKVPRANFLLGIIRRFRKSE